MSARPTPHYGESSRRPWLPRGAKFADDFFDDDTVELTLNAAQMRALADAAEEALAERSNKSPPTSARHVPSSDESALESTVECQPPVRTATQSVADTKLIPDAKADAKPTLDSTQILEVPSLLEATSVLQTQPMPETPPIPQTQSAPEVPSIPQTSSVLDTPSAPQTQSVPEPAVPPKAQPVQATLAGPSHPLTAGAPPTPKHQPALQSESICATSFAPAPDVEPDNTTAPTAGTQGISISAATTGAQSAQRTELTAAAPAGPMSGLQQPPLAAASVNPTLGSSAQSRPTAPPIVNGGPTPSIKPNANAQSTPSIKPIADAQPAPSFKPIANTQPAPSFKAIVNRQLTGVPTAPGTAPPTRPASISSATGHSGKPTRANAWYRPNRPLLPIAMLSGLTLALIIALSTVALRPASQQKPTPSAVVAKAATQMVARSPAKAPLAAPTTSTTTQVPSGASTSDTGADPSAPVRFRNPFDATEIFEFPPGTSLQEARESVAAVLLERGRERQMHLRPERRRANSRVSVSADLAQNRPRSSH